MASVATASAPLSKSRRAALNVSEGECALAASVFTHMRPPGVHRYLHEVSRVLRPGGKCLFTFFILNDVSRSHMASAAEFSFDHEMEGCWSIDRHLPERAIAYDEAEVRRMLVDEGMDVIEPIYYGSWSATYPKASVAESTGLDSCTALRHVGSRCEGVIGPGPR